MILFKIIFTLLLVHVITSLIYFILGFQLSSKYKLNLRKGNYTLRYSMDEIRQGIGQSTKDNQRYYLLKTLLVFHKFLRINSWIIITLGSVVLMLMLYGALN